MRVIDEEVSVQQLATVVKAAVSEEIQSIYEHKVDKFVNVTTILRDAEGAPVRTRVHEIVGSFYDMLMSGLPDYAPGKPAHEYRESDLWHVIDLMAANIE